MRNKGVDHVRALLPKEAAGLLDRLSSPIAKALREFLLALPPRKASSLPLFRVKYSYGQQIVAPRSDDDKFGKVLAPCPSSEICINCRELLNVLHHHRPLTLVLEGSCEEYIQYEQSSPRRVRRAPLYFHSKGDLIGITKLLNQIYYPDKPSRLIFGRVVRYMSSGARTIFFSSSLSNPRLSQYLLHQVPKSVLEANLGEGSRGIPEKELGKRFDADHWLFLRLIADAKNERDNSKPWQTQLLYLSVERLSILLKEADRNVEASNLLREILAASYVQSRNTRSDYLRQMAVFDRLSAHETSSYAVHTVSHLIELLRGQFPGLVPHDPSTGDDFGPYSAAYGYLQEEDISIRKFIDGFPLVLRPAHLGVADQQFVYYSLERPTLVAPVRETRSFRTFALEISDALNHLARDRRDLLDSAHWQFLISKGKPQGPTYHHRKATDSSMEFRLYQTDEQILNDFKPQVEYAIERQWLGVGTQLFTENKWGFMAAFARLSKALRPL